MTDTALLWFRSDLRPHDNGALLGAADADELLPVYVFDPQWFGTNAFGGSASFAYEKAGGHRTRFLRESVSDLRSSLRTRGSDLIVRHGETADALMGSVGTVYRDDRTRSAVDPDMAHNRPYEEAPGAISWW